MNLSHLCRRFMQAVNISKRPENIRREGQALMDALWRQGFRPQEPQEPPRPR